MMNVSIVIAHWNRFPLLYETLRSIYDRPSASWDGIQVVVVDDGSTVLTGKDEIFEWPIQYVQLPERKWYRNPCIPFNVGATYAEYDAIILQNPECWHHDDVISRVRSELKDDNYITFSCYSLPEGVDPNTFDVSTAEPRANRFDGDAGWYNHPEHRPTKYHFCSAITRANFEAIGGFSRAYAKGRGYDDDDFLRKAIDLGLDVRIDPATVLHQWHYTQSEPDAVVRPLIDRNHRIFAAGNPKGDGLKIAVYAIAKNEVGHVERWLASAADADHILLADTGSTDGTSGLARRLSSDVVNFDYREIVVSPWRFDVARNAALAMLPRDVDVAVALDLDEMLQPGWREAIVAAWKPGTTRLRYPYTWSWNADGSPKLVYYGDKVHARHGYRWRHPVHEVCYPYLRAEVEVWTDDLKVHQHADDTKSRAQYLPMLELAVVEDPTNDRNAHYLGREYFYGGRWNEAVAELERHLNLPTAVWKPERAASMRMIAKAKAMMGDRTAAECWHWRAIAECPDFREPLVDAAKFYQDGGDWPTAKSLLLRAIFIPEPPKSHIIETEYYRGLPHDLLSISEYYLGDRAEALKNVDIALSFTPDDERLVRNRSFMID